MRINMSDTLERCLRTIVRAEREKRWLEENRAAIEAYNQRVATHGLLADDATLHMIPGDAHDERALGQEARGQSFCRC